MSQHEVPTQRQLSMWTIYASPDPPHGFVVREWHVGGGDRVSPASEARGFRSLNRARDYIESIQPGVVRTPRDRDDDPLILETWL